MVDNYVNNNLYPEPTKTTSVSVKATLWADAKKNLIYLKDALEFGIKFLLADREGFDYPDCKLKTKLEKTVSLLNKKSQELEELRNSIETGQGKQTKEEIKEDAIKDIENVLGGEKDGWEGLCFRWYKYKIV